MLVMVSMRILAYGDGSGGGRREGERESEFKKNYFLIMLNL